MPYVIVLDMARLARQADFDNMVQMYVSDGASLTEAVEETVGALQDGGFSLDGIFLYQDQPQLEQKVKVESYLRMFDQVAQGAGSMVNLVFGLQGLSQNLSSKAVEAVRRGTLRLVEDKMLLQISLRLLRSLTVSDDREIEDNSNGEEQDDEDDEDEEKVKQKLHVLSFLNSVLELPSENFLNHSKFVALSVDDIEVLKSLLDADCGEFRLAAQYIALIKHLLKHEANRELLSEHSLMPELTLMQKMHKKNAELQAEMSSILTTLV